MGEGWAGGFTQACLKGSFTPRKTSTQTPSFVLTPERQRPEAWLGCSGLDGSGRMCVMRPARRQSAREPRPPFPATTAPLASSVRTAKRAAGHLHSHSVRWPDAGATAAPHYTPTVCGESTGTSTLFVPPRISRYLILSVNNNKQLSAPLLLSGLRSAANQLPKHPLLKRSERKRTGWQ